MRPKLRAATIISVVLATAFAPAAQALDMRIGDASVVEAATPAPLSAMSFSSLNSLSVGMTPAAGALAARPDVVDVSGEYSTRVYGGDVGVFAGRTERVSIFAPATAAAWNLGG